MLKKFLSVTAIVGISLSFCAHAEDRALLIGVGEYQNSEYNLPGIDLDINMMHKAAKLMGYQNIKTVLNEQATLHNVTQTIETFLVNGVNADDRVLIYFSGHGTRIPDLNGDETEDQADEVLTMYDLQPAVIAGKNSLRGVLVDDQFDEILRKIPSRNILVLLDACNSGTATKGLSLSRGTLGDGIAVYPKFLEYSGMPMAKGNFIPLKRETRGDFVAISAAGDTESAQATAKGSLFTLGVLKSINQAAKNNTRLTANILKSEVTRYIKVENTRAPFTPQLSGSTQLANKIIKFRTAQDGYGENWKKLVGYAEKAEPLKISINQTTYAHGDNLAISINNQRSGYLNVINVGPKDEATILFPNEFNPQAKVSGSISIPTNEMRFDLPASKPYGGSLIVAFLTDKPLNLYKSGDASRDNKGKIDNLFHSLSELGLADLKSFTVQEKSNDSKGNGIKAGKVITRVCASKC